MWAGHLSVKTWRLIFTHLFVSSSCRGTVWTSPALLQTDWHSASDSTSLLLLLLNSAIVKLHWLVGNFLSFFWIYFVWFWFVFIVLRRITFTALAARECDWNPRGPSTVSLYLRSFFSTALFAVTAAARHPDQYFGYLPYRRETNSTVPCVFPRRHVALCYRVFNTSKLDLGLTAFTKIFRKTTSLQISLFFKIKN